jgi:magnesium chelatase family protein
VLRHLDGTAPLPAPVPVPLAELAPWPDDLADVRGQAQPRRALEVAAAGGHHVLLVGPPGTGKTMLARRLPGLLPPLPATEALEVAAVRSLLGLPLDDARRPFRAPHHTASAPALVGGGGIPRPGEVSLAHRGVLFLDELPEFARPVLESLREPLSTGHVSVARASRTLEFPAAFQLVAAMNPCPCGYAGDPRQACRCSPTEVRRYQQRISGPLLDRIDLVVPVVRSAGGTAVSPGEPSAVVRGRVAAAMERQLARAGALNGRLDGPRLREGARLGAAARALLEAAVERFGLSARATDSVLRVARTLADLAASADLEPAHVAEAISLRRPAPT